jgi:hypothetical protein
MSRVYEHTAVGLRKQRGPNCSRRDLWATSFMELSILAQEAGGDVDADYSGLVREMIMCSSIAGSTIRTDGRAALESTLGAAFRWSEPYRKNCRKDAAEIIGRDRGSPAGCGGQRTKWAAGCRFRRTAAGRRCPACGIRSVRWPGRRPPDRCAPRIRRSSVSSGTRR